MPILRRVTDVTGEAAILSVRDGERQLTVSKVDGPQTFRVTSDPGHLCLLHTTSVGKVLVAFAADEDCHRLVEELEPAVLTNASITDRDVCREEIARVRQQGYAVMDEENEVGMRAGSVPVLNAQGTAFASLAVAAPIFRLTVEAMPVPTSRT